MIENQYHPRTKNLHPVTYEVGNGMMIHNNVKINCHWTSQRFYLFFWIDNAYMRFI